jgi:hypothetical protein
MPTTQKLHLEDCLEDTPQVRTPKEKHSSQEFILRKIVTPVNQLFV